MAKKVSAKKPGDKKAPRARAAKVVKSSSGPASARKAAAPAGAGVETKPAKKLSAKARGKTEAPEVVKIKIRKSVLSRKELNEFKEMLLRKRRQLLGDMNGMEAEAFRTNRQDGSGDLSNIPSTRPTSAPTTTSRNSPWACWRASGRC